MERIRNNGIESVEPIQVSDEEILEQIDREAGMRMGMESGQFAEAYRKGSLPDTLAANELAMMMRFVEISRSVPA